MRLRIAGALMITALCGGAVPARGQTVPVAAGIVTGADANAANTDITVIGRTPLDSIDADRAQVAASAWVLNGARIDRDKVADLTGSLLAHIPSASVNNAEGNPFQPDILFRGFTASPVEGTNQGLAVYLNGARFNQPFGDTVNWDLIPSLAIARIDVEGANPVFGLNALGGSVSVKLKDGFSYQGGDFTTYGGSYGRGAGLLQYGRRDGDWAVYAAGQILHESGWRQTSQSDLYGFYGDVGVRRDWGELHVNMLADSNALGNPGATPEQALAVSRSAIFTAPNVVWNKALQFGLPGSFDLAPGLSLHTTISYANLTQRLTNGVTTEVAACGDGSGLLCNGDGSVVTGRGGVAMPDFLHGGRYSGLGLQGTNSNAYGASAELIDKTPFWGHDNHGVVGLSLDGGRVGFDGQQKIGGLTADRFFIGPGITQDQPDAGIAPTKLTTTNQYWGVFATDLFTLVPGLTLNVSGRLNVAVIDLRDQIGTGLNGHHRFSSFNPGAGLAYALGPNTQVYASYAQANRAPTPVELSCANPTQPCQLPNFFIGDPNLAQVVARTFEIGLRGDVRGGSTLKAGWGIDAYRTNDRNDIIYVASLVPGLDYFRNAGGTRRQGFEAHVNASAGPVHATLGYALTDATFRSALTLASPLNPGADAQGYIYVRPGNRLPGIARNRVVATVDWDVTHRLLVGAAMTAASNQVLFGDEANLTKPLAGYFVLNLNASYRVSDRVSVFGLLTNITDTKYNTYGTFGPVADVGWADITPSGTLISTRDVSPAPPLGAYGGVRVSF